MRRHLLTAILTVAAVGLTAGCNVDTDETAELKSKVATVETEPTTTTTAPTTTTTAPTTTTTRPTPTTVKATTTLPEVDPADVFEMVVRSDTDLDVGQATEFAGIVCSMLDSGQSLDSVSETVVTLALSNGFTIDEIGELGTITGAGIYAFCPHHGWQIGA